MMNGVPIRLQQVAIGYNRHVVAEQLNLTFPAGQLTCLLGINGVGKSTLLRTLAAFQPPLSGRIMLGDDDLAACSDAERARRIGVVLTEKVQIQDFTTADLVAMGRLPYTGFWAGLNDEDRALVCQAIAQVHIEHLADRPLQTLSDGERQKALIAKALAQQTPVILLDEPTAFLDYPSKVEILLLLKQLSRTQGKTVVLSTHDVELALEMADALALMDEDGLRLVDSEAIVRRFRIFNRNFTDCVREGTPARKYKLVCISLT